MNKNISEILKEVTFSTKLESGLEIYICKKPGYEKKIGMFGTKYGSLINDFINVNTNQRQKVPDGVAHFLEHKLFEQEGANALDLFAKEGISANAYTTFDHTVYFFETNDKFEKGIEMLVKLVKTPYFTKENVEKEQGIIGQEISMYDDDPASVGYFNLLRAMYVKNNVRIDIAGTVESISNISKDILYDCYHTFYHPSNMFLVIVGDVDEQKTLELIRENVNKYDNVLDKKEIVSFMLEEPNEIAQKYIEKKIGIYMPQISIGYKMGTLQGKNIIKRAVVADFVSEMYFSKASQFFKKEYDQGNIADEIIFAYEGADSFSHSVISAVSTKPEIICDHIKEYIEKIKKEPIPTELFETTKKRKIGELVMSSEDVQKSYHRIIESLLNKTDIYQEVDDTFTITEQDVVEFLKLLDEKKSSISVVL